MSRCRCCPPAGRWASSFAATPARRGTGLNEERQLVVQIALEGSLVVENAVLRAAEQERLGALRAPGFPRLAHEAPEPGALLRPPPARARPHEPPPGVDRGAVPRPRRVQADQRQLRPRRRRPPAGGGRRRLQSCLRPEDTIARLGGDEFTVLLEDITDVRYAIRVAERIAESLKPTFAIDGHEASVTASIGIAVEHRPRIHPGRAAAELRPCDVPGEVRRQGAARRLPRRHDHERHAPAADSRRARARAWNPSDEQPDNGAVTEEPALEGATEAQDDSGSVEGVGLFGRTRGAAADDDRSPDAEIVDVGAGRERPSSTPTGDEEPTRPRLSEARRRRRLRFPPR